MSPCPPPDLPPWRDGMTVRHSGLGDYRITEPRWERFWALVDDPDPVTGCWPWGGQVTTSGYGRFPGFAAGRHGTVLAHRIAYTLLAGPIPDGLTLDHLCRRRLCVNPGHLRPMTMRDNVLAGAGPAAVNAAKTACPAGHPYSPENTFTNLRGARNCRVCHRERQRRWRAKKRQQVQP